MSGGLQEQAMTSRVLLTDRWTERHRQQCRHFPHPAAKVINWNRDPQQQSLLLDLWSQDWHTIMSWLCMAVSVRQNDPLNGHYKQGNGSVALGMVGGGALDQRAADILSSSVITDQCLFNFQLVTWRVCATAHVAVFANMLMSLCGSCAPTMKVSSSISQQEKHSSIDAEIQTQFLQLC